MLCETAFVLCKSSPYHNNKFETLLAKSHILPKHSKVGLVKRLIKWKTNYQTYAFKYDHDKIYIFFYRKIRILLTAPNQKNAHQSTYRVYKGTKKAMRWKDWQKRKTLPSYFLPQSQREHTTKSFWDLDLIVLHYQKLYDSSTFKWSRISIKG